MAGWFALAVALQSAPYLPAGRPCTAQEMADLTTPSDQPYRLICRADTGGARHPPPGVDRGPCGVRRGAGLRRRRDPRAGPGDHNRPDRGRLVAPPGRRLVPAQRRVHPQLRRRGQCPHLGHGGGRIDAGPAGLVPHGRTYAGGPVGGADQDRHGRRSVSGRGDHSPLYRAGGDADHGDPLALFRPVDLGSPLSGRRKRRRPDPGQRFRHPHRARTDRRGTGRAPIASSATGCRWAGAAGSSCIATAARTG